jgi:hypothetical protein
VTRRTFGALLAAPLIIRAENAKTRGEQAIKECIAALGGNTFLNMQDRLETGLAASFYREKVSGMSPAELHTRYREPPNPIPVSFDGLLERQVFGKKKEDVVLFTPDGGWEVTFRGVRPLPDETVSKHKEAVIANFLYILRMRLNEPGLSIEHHGLDVADNQRVERVDILDDADRSISVYLNADTKLPVMQRYMRFDPFYKEKIEEVTRWSKYRQIGGLTWPLTVVREHDGEMIYQMFSDRFSINNNFDPKLFQLPQGMQMLKKESF